MSDVPFHQTRMGVKFLEYDVPKLVEALRALGGLEPLPVPKRPVTHPMTKERFEQELKDIQNSFPFQNMLEHFPHLKDEPVHKISLIYHAFKMNCSEEPLNTPLLIGGYINLCVEHPHALPGYVADVRRTWGPR